MRIAFLDCFSGISGDMMLGALLDLGFSESDLKGGLAQLPLSGYEIDVSRQERRGFPAVRVEVRFDAQAQPQRDYAGIRSMLTASSLADRVRSVALEIFECIAQAEAAVHGVPIERVHFHEVGAVDSIVDIVGVALGLEALGIDQVYVSELPLGSGWVSCAHGLLPVPAPATAEILKGMRVIHDHPAKGELVTPTGAAIAATLAHRQSAWPPPMEIAGIGYGAGSRDFQSHPNLLRVVTGETEDGYERDRVRMLECQIDDLQPEIYPYLVERLLEAGARDVVLVPAHMKKGRPGILVQVVADAVPDRRLLAVLFAETTTLGVRTYEAGRVKLGRRAERIETSLGPVAVKAVEGPGLETPELRPEHEECRRLARERGLPLRKVYEEVQKAIDSRKHGS
ncbi:MAG: nickel pincer cofactor biosynthesis protein LarC [bacterium]